MGNKILETERSLRNEPKRWLVTGAAGFIGSNLVEYLLSLDQKVVGLDDFSTGHRRNLEDLQKCVGHKLWGNFQFYEGSIVSLENCRQAADGCDFVLHQAAFGSVPKSIEDPCAWNQVNVAGFLNMIVAARDAQCRGFVYASSSSVYGTDDTLPKIETRIGEPLSPYAVSKYTNELYAKTFWHCYDFSSVGLRYFNVFGPRQDPNGAYAAVIPRWIDSMLNRKPCTINGDGAITRDFCYISNVLQANILAAVSQTDKKGSKVFNVGVGETTNLRDLHAALAKAVSERIGEPVIEPTFGPARLGDIQQSLASIDSIKTELGYAPMDTLLQGIAKALPWYAVNTIKS